MLLTAEGAPILPGPDRPRLSRLRIAETGPTFYNGTGHSRRGEPGSMSVADSAIDLERTLRERFGLERFRPGQREVIEQVLAGPRRPLRHADRRRQEPLLPVAGAAAAGPDAGRQPADRPDEGPGRRPDRSAGIRATLLNSTLDPAEQRARLARDRGGPVRPRLRRPRAVPQPPVRRGDGQGPARPCWRSTRPTASASGATTSGPTTPGSARPAGSSARPPASP